MTTFAFDLGFWVGVGHHAFLTACTDRPGVGREAIHQRTADLAVTFFSETLSSRGG